MEEDNILARIVVGIGTFLFIFWYVGWLDPIFKLFDIMWAEFKSILPTLGWITLALIACFIVYVIICLVVEKFQTLENEKLELEKKYECLQESFDELSEKKNQLEDDFSDYRRGVQKRDEVAIESALDIDSEELATEIPDLIQSAFEEESPLYEIEGEEDEEENLYE
jgi:hypothetical protein